MELETDREKALDQEIAQHQQRLDEIEDRIGMMEVQGEPRAERLRRLHQRVSGNFARLRKAFGDDWAQMRDEAEAGLHELRQDLADSDAVLGDVYEAELASRDAQLDRVHDELEAACARAEAPAALRELSAQLEAVRQSRPELEKLPPADRKAAVARYATAVQRLRARRDELEAAASASPPPRSP